MERITMRLTKIWLKKIGFEICEIEGCEIEDDEVCLVSDPESAFHDADFLCAAIAVQIEDERELDAMVVEAVYCPHSGEAGLLVKGTALENLLRGDVWDQTLN